MSEQSISATTPYEPPRVEDRASIEGNLDTLVSGLSQVSAAFRPL
jgi:hypothetical protein